jgi:hypothetical protein
VSIIFVHVRILMDEWGHGIDMFRLGSLPLERIFGTLRQRSRDNHTFDRAMKQIPAMQFLRFYQADHCRITRKLKFDHVMCLANSGVPSRLHGVNRVRWARDALRFLIDAHGFCHDAVYFICICERLKSKLSAFPVRRPQTLSLTFIAVVGAGSLKIRERFMQETKQIFMQPWHPQEDCLLLDYVGKRRVAWKKLAQQQPTRPLSAIKRRFRQ